MDGVVGLQRFRKSQSLEPFSVTFSSTSTERVIYPSVTYCQPQASQHQPNEVVPPLASASLMTLVGGGQSTWQPPDWAIEPRVGVYYLEVLKDGAVICQFNLDKQRHIFGRQLPMCDFVLDHASISRQHAAVVTHQNGGIYVIDLGSVHGTFVANQRLTKDNPVELKVGQSLRFAASTRTYILRENIKASDEEPVIAYPNGYSNNDEQSERGAKRTRKARVTFRDETGGELSEVIGMSDGADVETEISPVGVISLIGEYESLVKIGHVSSSENGNNQKGVTDKLQEVLNKVESAPEWDGIYDELCGESFPVEVGSSGAYASVGSGDRQAKGKPGSGYGDDDYHYDDLLGN